MENEKEKVWAVLSAPKDLRLIPHGTDVMTLDEFIECVEDGSFIDYDGHGNWATQTHLLPFVNVYPSNVRKHKDRIPDWVTHVCWYNR